MSDQECANILYRIRTSGQCGPEFRTGSQEKPLYSWAPRIVRNAHA